MYIRERNASIGTQSRRGGVRVMCWPKNDRCRERIHTFPRSRLIYSAQRAPVVYLHIFDLLWPDLLPSHHPRVASGSLAPTSNVPVVHRRCYPWRPTMALSPHLALHTYTQSNNAGAQPSLVGIDPGPLPRLRDRGLLVVLPVLRHVIRERVVRVRRAKQSLNGEAGHEHMFN